MQVTVTNVTPYTQYIDVDGNEKTDDTVVLGSKARETITLPSEKRFLALSKEFAKKVTFRKA